MVKGRYLNVLNYVLYYILHKTYLNDLCETLTSKFLYKFAPIEITVSVRKIEFERKFPSPKKLNLVSRNPIRKVFRKIINFLVVEKVSIR